LSTKTHHTPSLHDALPISAIETEEELDLLMKHSSVPLLFDAGHMAFAGGDVLRVIDNHHTRITHVHTKDIRRTVVDGLDRNKERSEEHTSELQSRVDLVCR